MATATIFIIMTLNWIFLTKSLKLLNQVIKSLIPILSIVTTLNEIFLLAYSYYYKLFSQG